MRCSSVSLRGSFTAGNLKGMEVVLTPLPASAGPVWRAGWWGLMRRVVVMALLSRGVHGVATTATFSGLLQQFPVIPEWCVGSKMLVDSMMRLPESSECFQPAAKPRSRSVWRP
jgi:hypothetical protein